MITKLSVVYATIPFIIIEKDNVINTVGTSQSEIDFNELGAYIRILEQQQAAIGLYVNFSKGTYIENNKPFAAFVIAASATPPPPDEFEKEISFNINGVDFISFNSLSVIANGIVNTLDKVTASFNPCIVSFLLPSLTEFQETFTNEYVMPAGMQILKSEQSGGNWLVTVVIEIADNTPATFNITGNSFVLLDVSPFLTGSVLYFGNDFNTNGKALTSTSTYVRKDTGYFISPLSSVKGCINVAQFEGVNQVTDNHAQAFSETIVPFSTDVNKISLGLFPVRVRKMSGDLIGGFMIGLDQIRRSYGVTNSVHADNSEIIKEQKDQLFYNGGANVASQVKVAVSVCRNGMALQSFDAILDGDDHAVNMNYVDFDEVKLYATPPGSGFPINVRYANGSPCGAGFTQVFIGHSGIFVTGDTIYNNVGLSLILTGATQIYNVINGIIYNIDSATGVIGTATGLFCGGVPNNNVIISNALGSHCGFTPGTYYTDDGVIASGKVLYYDIDLTSPVTGYSYVSDPLGDTVIYNMASLTGVIGSNTGQSC